MKRLLVACGVSVLSTIGLTADDGHLFILSGQSNMAGLKSEVSFTPAVQEAFGEEKVTVVKDAQSGQPIRRWVKGWEPAEGELAGDHGDLYVRLMEKVAAAGEGKSFKTVTFIWMQGERDARESHGEVYGRSFEALVKQIQKDLGRDDVMFVIGRLSDFDNDNQRYPHWSMVRDAQVALAEESDRGVWVDTDDLNNKKKGEKMVDDLHYTRKGYATLGERFAEAAIALIKKQ